MTLHHFLSEAFIYIDKFDIESPQEEASKSHVP